MARVKCHDRRKMSVECLHFVLLIQSFTQCFLHTLAVESHSQGEKKIINVNKPKSWTRFISTLPRVLIYVYPLFINKTTALLTS